VTVVVTVVVTVDVTVAVTVAVTVVVTVDVTVDVAVTVVVTVDVTVAVVAALPIAIFAYSRSQACRHALPVFPKPVAKLRRRRKRGVRQSEWECVAGVPLRAVARHR
jgi:hypothetical protein